MKKIIIVDDNSLLRENISGRLQEHYQLLLEATSALELLDYFSSVPREGWPDLVLMDIEMDEMDGIQATAALKANYPSVKVAMLTVFEQEERVWQSILAGADGYILKDEPKERLLNAIEDILNGGAYMSPNIALKAFNLLKRYGNPGSQQAANQLTSREYEILELIAQGLSYKQIADKTFISVFTAKTHIHHIYEKLQVNNKTEAALKLGVKQPSPGRRH